jgi:hypothetical protein
MNKGRVGEDRGGIGEVRKPTDVPLQSGCQVEVFAENSKPKGFEDIVPMSLHTYANVFSEMAFDSLPERRKWDHAIELEREPSPGFHKVYLMTLTEQIKMDTFLEEALATGCIRQSM